MTNARAVAIDVLYRVADKGAYAAAALSAELGRAGLSGRDAALATEIVYGSLRVLPELDEAYGRHLNRPGGLDPYARAALRSGSYELRHLSRVPARAAVHETVGVVGRARGRKLSGFVNAILRKVAADAPEDRAPPTSMAVPAWLADRLVDDLGEDRARSFLCTRKMPPPIGLRARDPDDRDALVRDLREARPDAEVTPGTVARGAVLVRRAGDPTALPGHAEGRFTVQEQGAQRVVELVDAQAGESILDACAGRGGKTLSLLAAVGPNGSVTATDLHEQKLDRIAAEASRLGLSTDRLTTDAIDLSVGTGGMTGEFDRVLVDAPCTGLGTLHRRPEILLRVGADDPARMAALQSSILERAARLVRPGGTVVYAVCSPMRAEGRPVVERLSAHASIEVLREESIGPWLGDCDVYQVLQIRVDRCGSRD